MSYHMGKCTQQVYQKTFLGTNITTPSHLSAGSPQLNRNEIYYMVGKVIIIIILRIKEPVVS